MDVPALAGALAQVLAFLVLGWVAGGLIAARLLPGADLGLPERTLLAIVGGTAGSVAFMVLHIATGGLVFGTTWVVPLLAGAAIVAGRRHFILPGVARPARALALVAVLVVLFAVPVIAGGSSVRSGDPPLHLGWSEQVLAGDPVPTGMAPEEFSRNSYPWGFHAVIATLVRMVPGTDPVIAHDALHFLFIIALPAIAASLARVLDRRAGWSAAMAATLIAGFGWIGAARAEYIATPSEARFGGDLVAGSPNAVYELYPPVLPRELGLVLLVAGGMWVVIAATRADRRSAILGGICVGLAGLVNLPLFLPGTFWIAAAALVARSGTRIRTFVAAYLPALIVLFLWGLRVAVDYLRLGGFVNVTPKLGVEWPVDSALWSWGLLVPAAIAGIYIALRAKLPASRQLLALVAASGILLLLGVGRARFDWSLLGNETLLHQGRVWPPLHVIAAAFAGVAIIRALDALTPRSRMLAASALAALVLIGGMSLVYASRSITILMNDHEDGFLYSRPDLIEGSFVRRAADRLDSDDVVAVTDDHEIAFLLFQFSGTRLLGYDDPNRPENELRIRFADLAAAWTEDKETGAIEPDYYVSPAGDPDAPDGEVLVEGIYEGREWQLIKLGS
jgi:hypothetical protein